MKIFLYITLLISIILILGVRNSYSSHIIVNPTLGNDSLSGLDTLHPIQSLKQAGKIAQGGDTIFIRGGRHINYHDDTFYRYDQQTTRIIIMPYIKNGILEDVILDGTGWTFIHDYDAIFTIQHSRYIDIRNLTFRMNKKGVGLRVVSDDTLCSTPISRYVNIYNCKVDSVWEQGILIQASNVLVENCEVSNAVLNNRHGNDSLSNSFAMGTYLHPACINLWTNIVFRNNKIHNCWGEGILLIRTENFTIENNHVYDCWSCYIYVDNSYNGIIRSNWIGSTNDTFNRQYRADFYAPGNGIFWATEGNNYVINRMVENISIYNNLIVRTNAAFGWFSHIANTFPNNSYRNINIYNNTVSGTIGITSFYLDTDIHSNRIAPTNCNFKNNILCKSYFLSSLQSYFTNSPDYYSSAWNIQKNCFTDYDIPINPTSNIQGSPSFINPNINLPDSFKITSNSICKAAGVFLDSVLNDYWNAPRFNPPCIGFHEFGSVSNLSQIGTIKPSRFNLSQNYPNPFNPNTVVSYQLPVAGFVQLKVYDNLGNEIETLVNEKQNAGGYSVDFNASKLPSGIYFYKLVTESFSETKKMVLVK